MQRTRHASLDFPRTHRLSPQEEWCEFLSASMAALTTEDDDDVGSRSLNSIPGLEVRRTGGVFDPLGAERRDEPSALGGLSNGKPLRRESFSESLTSSSGSSPAGAAWRPLGRRASAHVVSTSNQLEHHLEYGGFDIQPFGQANNNTNGNVTKTLPHTSSFRDTLRASSSGSSLVESSSSDEEPAEVIGNTLDNNAFEAPFGVPSLPGLSTLSESSHDLSVDTRTAPVMHVKSPVLSNRKDAQTWQLQDEELLTSPRFGQFRSPLDEAGGSVFGGSMGLFPEDNQVLDARETRTRATKDTRASSVDFTFSRPADLNPPLPPPQEPQLNRLRGRSFSYSAGFGSNNYNPAYVNKQYVPPQQPEFPVTMRQFHAGAPPPPQPTSMLQQGVVRPPRVSIPSNDVQSYHQHQAQPPQYRRYSTDYAAPPYPDHVMPHESDVNPHRTPTGRGMRSYSMEYFQTNQRVRTHSLEGNQMFAPAAPPVEYPVVGRHASGAVTYEWPRSPLGAPPAPPLPPDARVGNGSNNQYPPPPPEAFYEVEFKRGRTELFAGNAGYNPGEYVKVEADRGEDIGRVARRITDISKFTSSSSGDPNSHAEDGMNRPKRHDLPGKKIISVANARECELLSEQRKEEHEVFEVCKSKVRQRLLPMNVIDAEYQFDRHKLTFFFEADRRIDFRELVRDLFAIYKTRIWLQQVVPNGKKSMNELEMMN